MKSLMDHKHELLLAHAGLACDPESAQAPAAPEAGPTPEAGPALVMALLRTAALIDRACAAELGEYDLTEGRLSVLLVVASDPGATPAAIADQLGISRAAVTGLVDGLERQALIERQTVPGDRRSTAIALTPAGQDALDRIGPAYGSWLRQLADGVSPAAAGETAATLAVIQRNLTGGGQPRG